MDISRHITNTFFLEIGRKLELVKRQSLLLGCVKPMTGGSEKKA
jgi:hypothetical protein